MEQMILTGRRSSESLYSYFALRENLNKGLDCVIATHDPKHFQFKFEQLFGTMIVLNPIRDSKITFKIVAYEY